MMDIRQTMELMQQRPLRLGFNDHAAGYMYQPPALVGASSLPWLANALDLGGTPPHSPSYAAPPGPPPRKFESYDKNHDGVLDTDEAAELQAELADARNDQNAALTHIHLLEGVRRAWPRGAACVPAGSAGVGGGGGGRSWRCRRPRCG
jgi:hypothetical protein